MSHTDLPKLRIGKVGGQVCKGAHESYAKTIIRLLINLCKGRTSL